MFDRMPLQWNYEPEGHALAGRGYLPDFFLPQLDAWFEVKPDETDGSERTVFQALVNESGRRGLIAYGPPIAGRQNLWLFIPDGDPSGPYYLAEDRRDDGVYWLGHDTEAFVIGGPGQSTDHDRAPTYSHRPIADAFKAAAAERFGT